MNVNEIKSNDDVLNFIEGTLNDYRMGVSSIHETTIAILDLMKVVAKMAQEKQGKTNPSK